ncbi:MAG TPA: putative toxin-antitoxin system toxin component, PIN family [Pirellulales bacterium]|nr:putative toxin-antitoxin system toxin component, PIN family [Pirellulales bacterium]
MIIVCDTNVLVRAAINHNGLAAELLARIRSSHVLVASYPLLAELLVVLRRPKIRALHGLDERGIRRFVSSLYKIPNIVQVPKSLPRIVPRDPKDDAQELRAVQP